VNKRINRVINEIQSGTSLHVGCTGGLFGKPEYSINSDREDSFDINLGENSLHLQLINKFGQDKIYGFDISEEKINFFKNELAIKNIVSSSVEEYKSDNLFDNIIFTEVIEHLQNPGYALENLKNLLSEEGKIIITTPYAYSIYYSIYAWLNYPNSTQNKEHTMLFCPSTISLLANYSGLKIDKLELIADHPTRFKNRIYQTMYFILSNLFKILPKKVYAKTMFVVLKKY
tara:strand:+ start:322 stop:1011 length:690 start_codon:yes stop_codon:yes gene_type:complete